MKKNIWEKWRGKNRIIEKKMKLTTENEKIDKRMSKKIEEYKQRREEKLKKRDDMEMK